MEKLITTRYNLDKEDNKTYTEALLNSEAWRCGLIDPERLLKLPKYFGKPCLDGGSVNFYQREGDMDNLPDCTITTSNGLSIGEMTEIFMKQPVQVQEFPTFDQAIEKICNELKEDESYYIAWKSAIAMSFKDEYWRTYSTEVAKEEELQTIHEIANKAADNFLKQLIG